MKPREKSPLPMKSFLKTARLALAAAFSAAFVARGKKNAARHDKRQAKCHNNNFFEFHNKTSFLFI